MDITHSNSDVEAPKDPGAHKPHTNLDDTEILGHRSSYIAINAPVGGSSRHSHHHHHHSGGSGRAGANGGRSHRHRGGRRGQLKAPSENNRPVTPPSQRVQFILGEDHDDTGHEPHPLFSELGELVCDADGEMEWHETARWVKFEEDVEEGGNRWSKPHVATLSLHSLFELRSMLLNGTICLDMAANNLDDICELLLDNMINSNVITYDKKVFVKDAILKRHRHQYQGMENSSSKKIAFSASYEQHEGAGGNSNLSCSGSGVGKRGILQTTSSNFSKFPIIRSLTEIGRIHSSAKSYGADGAGYENGEFRHNASADGLENGVVSSNKMNSHFMKKLPKGAEASNILVGELNVLDKPLSALIRLRDAVSLGDLTEVPVPTRFIFLLLGPAGEDKINVSRYHEVGRAVATIMADEVFHDVAYKAKKREHLLAGIDEFLDAVTVLPPGEWDPSIRIEPPCSVPSQDARKQGGKKKEVHHDEEEEERKQREEAGLTRSGRIFGGLLNDIKRKKPWYLSDFKDGIALQCVASFFFIYFACLTPIITFGGLLGDATENRIAAIESLVSGLIVGVTYGLFSGQPLTILGSTGPILVFETIMYDFCRTYGWDYLAFRFCIGVWVGIILMILVALDASAFVCYITRFTEENFACLIAFIFIKKAFDKVIHIGDNYPLEKGPCYCKPTNSSVYNLSVPEGDFVGHKETKPHVYPCTFDTENAVDVPGIQSVGCHYHPNAFLMSLLLFFGTYLVSHHLKQFKTSNFLPAYAKNFISDFAVFIAIVSMTCTDLLVGVDTPKLRVPDTLRPTWSGRGWVIHPIGSNPWWTPIAAIIPAILGTILIFMDQQITAVIVNRKEHKLEKGGGYHLDLFIVAILIMVCSVFGLPWFVAATVLSINHVKSLTRESETAAPGEKPQFLGIREQRVTHVLIFIMIGLSVLMTPMLSMIPMPVLYGVFLYMGVASLNGLQFYDRLQLFFMPKKYQPDLPYLRCVPLLRVHLFTAIQFACLVGLWVVKDIKQTSILFPIMLVVMMAVRKLLDYVFEKQELKILDDILPEFKRHEKLDDEEGLEDVDSADGTKDQTLSRRASLRVTNSSIAVTMANGNVMMIPVAKKDEEDEDDKDNKNCHSGINISEEVNKSGVWTSLEGNNIFKSSKKDSKKRCRGDSYKKRMSVVQESEAEDSGITIKASDLQQVSTSCSNAIPDEIPAMAEESKPF